MLIVQDFPMKDCTFVCRYVCVCVFYCSYVCVGLCVNMHSYQCVSVQVHVFFWCTVCVNQLALKLNLCGRASAVCVTYDRLHTCTNACWVHYELYESKCSVLRGVCAWWCTVAYVCRTCGVMEERF